MKKTIKIVLFLCALTAISAVIFASCSLGTSDDDFVIKNPVEMLPKPEDTNTEQREETPLEKEHKAIIAKLQNMSYELSYSELYALYSEVVSHKKECYCDISLNTLLNYMLLGEWKADNGAILRFTYIFDDYYDKNGRTAFETNLQTSKEAGKSYYYYFDYRDNNLIIGYTDVSTNENTENFVVSFHDTYISLENKINQTLYTLKGNFNYQKVIKGRAKLAYEHVTAVISTFNNPESTVITNCYVHTDNNVYITIEYDGKDGEKKTEQYEISIANGQYKKRTFPYLATSNVDLTELNQMLKEFLANEEE